MRIFSVSHSAPAALRSNPVPLNTQRHTPQGTRNAAISPSSHLSSSASSAHRAVLTSTPAAPRRVTEDFAEEGTIQKIPGKQKEHLESVLVKAPLVRFVMNEKSVSSLYTRPTSTFITMRLNEFYKAKAADPALDLSNAEKSAVAELEKFTLMTGRNGAKEMLFLPDALKNTLEKMSGQFSSRDYNHLLQRVFGDGVSLDADLHAGEAKTLTTALVDAARNHTAVFESLEALGKASKPQVKFGIYSSRAELDAHDLEDFVKISSDPESGLTEAQLDARAFSRGENVLIPAAFLALRTYDARFPTPKSVDAPDALAAHEAWKFLSADTSYISGLLPSQLFSSADDPLHQVKAYAEEALSIADRMDKTHAAAQGKHADPAKPEQAKIDRLFAKLLVVIEYLNQASEKSLIKHPRLMQLFNEPSEAAPLLPPGLTI